jgi:hypothetical protein
MCRDETKSHQTYAGAEPRKKRPLFREVIRKSPTASPSMAVSVSSSQDRWAGVFGGNQTADTFDGHKNLG